jgi:hypothetical protein
MRLSFASVVVSSLLLTAPAFAAPKDKTKGLPEAGRTPAEASDAAVREAKTKLSVAQGNVERAQDAFAAAIADAKKKVDASPEVSAAAATAKQAQYDYEAASGPALAKARGSREYQDALDAKLAAQKKVTALQAESGTPQSEITAAARIVLEKAKVTAQIEAAALASDPTIAQLKAKLDAANAAVLKARRDAELASKSDPAITDAKATLEKAQAEVPPLQAAYNSAKAKYDGDVASRDKQMANTSANKPADNAGAATPGAGKFKGKKPFGKKKA